MARRRNSGITSLRFNQDQGCFTCCLSTGLRIYNVEPLVEKAHYTVEEVGEVALCEMVCRTNWLLLVRTLKPASLLLLDGQRRKFKAEVVFKSPIRALRARRDKVAVVLSTSIQVLTLPEFQRVALIRTPHCPRPLCSIAVSQNAPCQLLAAPAHRTGSLQLLDISRSVKGAQSTPPTVIGCHQGALVCLSVSQSGLRVATASERGTMIRVWDGVGKTLVCELRRGTDYADVYCLNFNASASLLSCTSDKGTVHVWSLASPPAHLAAASAPPRVRALVATSDKHTATVICEDGTFHKFTFSAEGSCHRSDFEYFLQVGDDEDFIQ